MKQRVEQINLKMAKEHGLIDEEEVSYEKARSAIINPENFTKRIESSDIEISPGVRLGSQTIELGAGNFTNLYDVYFNKNDATLSTQIITKTTTNLST